MIGLSTIVPNFIIKKYYLAESIDKRLKDEYGYDAYSRYTEFRDAKNGYDTLASYDYTANDLAKFTDDPIALNQMLIDYRNIPLYLTETQQDELVAYKRTTVLNNYIEYNNYYRTLSGLPPFVMEAERLNITKASLVYCTENLIGVDKTKPVHEYSSVEKKSLRVSGALDRLIAANPKLEYLQYLDKNIDIDTMRSAEPYDIIYANTSTYPELLKFMNHYILVRKNYLAAHHSEFDASYSKDHESIHCVYLIMVALGHTIAYAPRDRLDSQTIEESELYDLFQSYGIPKFNFSLKYLNEIAARINSLIMKKGTKASMKMISNMFNEITIFKYFLVKKLVNNGSTSLDGLSNDEKYELFYVRTPLDVDDPYEYMQVEDNLVPFEKVAAADSKWGPGDGDLLTSEIKNIEDFNYSEGKYLGIDNKINIATFSLEIAHFYRFIIEHKPVLKDIKFYIETANYEATLFELITYLQCLIFRKMKLRPDIPDTMESVVYMYGIKNNVDYETIKLKLKDYFRFSKYKIDIDNFVDLIDGKRYNMGDVIDDFETNYNIILLLKDFQRNVITDTEDFDMIDSVIRAITYSEKIPEYYDGHTNLEDYLGSATDNSLELILRLDELSNSADPLTSYNNEINEVINYLRVYADEIQNKTYLDMLDTTQSVYADLDILKYLEKIIDFFKSYTQDLFARGLTYALDTIDEGIKVTEHLSMHFQLEDWEMATLSLIFTDQSNEFLDMVKEVLDIEGYVTCNETLELVDPYTRQTRLVGFSGKYTI